MRIQVLLSSGEVDNWERAADAVVVDNYLHVLMDIDGDEVDSTIKIFELKREITRPAMRPEIKTVTYQLLAMYAPSMWMQVKFD